MTTCGTALELCAKIPPDDIRDCANGKTAFQGSLLIRRLFGNIEQLRESQMSQANWKARMKLGRNCQNRVDEIGSQ